MNAWAFYDSSGAHSKLVDWTMERAARSAHELAIQTNTGIVLIIDGIQVELSAVDLLNLRDLKRLDSTEK